MVTDTIDGVIIDADESGFYAIFSGENAEYRFDIQSIAPELLKQALREIGPWWNEGQDARRTRITNSEEDVLGLGYDNQDPKHPAHLDTFGDVT